MKKNISIIFALAFICCFSFHVSAAVQPLIYWNDTTYQIDIIQPELDAANPQEGSHEDYYNIPPIVYDEKEFIIAGKIENIISSSTAFIGVTNGTANNYFPIGAELYYRNSDNELFIRYNYDGMEIFKHLIPLSQNDRYYCFDPAPVDISLGAGIEEPVLP